MWQTLSWLLVDFPPLVGAAVATHLVVSLGQTLMHSKLGHHPMGGRFFRNHIDFHHRSYSKDSLVSREYLGTGGNNTPYFLIPISILVTGLYFLLPLPFFVVVAAACALSFMAHVMLDKAYHVEGSWLLRFARFRHMQQLHFAHHRHANCNFAVIDFFWDRLLGTFSNSPRGR